MDAAWNAAGPYRGQSLLLEHCAAFERFDETRPTAHERLERAIGGELAHLLLRALAGDHGRRWRAPAT
jgi:hypothetical protein